jgi:hypothetical protein
MKKSSNVGAAFRAAILSPSTESLGPTDSSRVAGRPLGSGLAFTYFTSTQASIGPKGEGTSVFLLP